MKIEDGKSNDFGNNKTKSDGGENDIRSRLRKNPNKTKFLYTGDFNDQKSKKKNDGSSPTNEKEICRFILETIKKDEKSFLFRQPAIKSFIDAKDKEYYKKQIKEPRDLGTIAKKLKTNDYSAKNFYDDMELCWSNAMSFNDTNTEAYQNAVYLKNICNKLYKEKGLLDYINKEEDKDLEKDVNSNNHGSSNNNTNDSNTPNKTLSKINKKDKSKNKKDTDISEKMESISSNSYNSDKSSVKNDNTDSSYSSEIKNNNLIGKKRKRQKNKDNKTNEQNEEKDEENNNISEEKEKKIPKKRGRKKKVKNEENNIDLNQSNTSNKLSLEDIKKKYPIKHQIFSGPDDLDKIFKKESKRNSKNKLNDNNNNSIHRNSERHRKRKNSNSNSNANSSFMTKEESRKIFYEYMWEFFNGKPFFPNYFDSQGQVNPYFQKFGNDYFNYNPMRYKTENKQMMNYDTNCNTENVYNMNSTNQKRKQSQSKINSKGSKKNNTQNNNNNNNNEVKTVNSTNNSNNGNIVKINDKKSEKDMQLRIEIAKYFDNLSDNNMIDVLVYIENIRPQSLRVLQNDTIYIDMEAFNEETFNKVFEFVKKYF